MRWYIILAEQWKCDHNTSTGGCKHPLPGARPGKTRASTSCIWTQTLIIKIIRWGNHWAVPAPLLQDTLKPVFCKRWCQQNIAPHVAPGGTKIPREFLKHRKGDTIRCLQAPHFPHMLAALKHSVCPSAITWSTITNIYLQEKPQKRPYKACGSSCSAWILNY